MSDTREAYTANSKLFEMRERGDLDGLVEYLRSPLETPDFCIRFAAVVQLGKLGDSRAVPHIVPLLGDSDFSVRAGAIVALRRLNAVSAAQSVADALDDRHPGVRQRAAEALGTLGTGHPEAISALVAALSDDVWHVRRSALQSVSRIGDSTVVPLLQERAGREQLWRRRHYRKAITAVSGRSGR